MRYLPLVVALAAAAPVHAQGTPADYARSAGLRDWTQGKVFRDRVEPNWFAEGTKFWYRVDLPDRAREFVVVDAITGKRGPAFDHAKLAAALGPVAATEVRPTHLPFDFIAMDGEKVRFVAFDKGRVFDPKDGKVVEGPKPTAPKLDTVPPRKGGGGRPQPTARGDNPWTVTVRDHNLFVKKKDATAEQQLTKTGTAADAYTERGLAWSPDFSKVVALRVQPGENRKVQIVQSSPRDQLQPKLVSLDYAKPGDRLAVEKPHLFDVAAGREIPVSDALFPNPWGGTRARWDADGKAFSFMYNQRGHQALRLIEVDATTGTARAVINEESKTFIDYAAKQYLHEVPDTGELVWMSERDGWNHLYLIDRKSGTVKNPITKGEWVVRGVERVDDEERQIWFRAGGVHPGQDPYYLHFCRINFDGTGLVKLTEGDGTHAIRYSPDRRFYLDTYSRVDLAPITELRRTEDGKLLCELERGDFTALTRAGWRTPERFVAKGRDGKTDIYGVIYRPTTFDPAKKYAVIEKIYAGPQDSFVPKAFRAFFDTQEIAELGFVTVQIDGMGTSNRSKAFHDVCCKNLADAGFPDRILWMQSAAAKDPALDLGRVGVYGGSAGGQNALGALLTHGDFYKAAAADCGCHDNRMDKVWWNELWMGYPVGPHYAEQSNVTMAPRLTGKLLLTVGEVDKNVDPASTMQVVNALVKAGKDFDLVVLPGADHGAGGGPYGARKRKDFFVRHLLGVRPPEWTVPTVARLDPPPVAPKRDTPPVPKLDAQPVIPKLDVKPTVPEKKAEPAKKEPEPKKEPVKKEPEPKKTDEPKKEPAKKDPEPKKAAEPEPPDLVALVAKPGSSVRPLVRHFEADRGSLRRAYPILTSPEDYTRLRRFYQEWRRGLANLATDKLDEMGRKELAELLRRVDTELADLETGYNQRTEIMGLLPFAEVIVSLEAGRRRTEPIDAVPLAAKVTDLRKQIEAAHKTADFMMGKGEITLTPGFVIQGLYVITKARAERAAAAVTSLQAVLRGWHEFYTGYDPLFTWWVGEPYKECDAALTKYAKLLKDKAASRPEKDPNLVLPVRVIETSDAPVLDLSKLMTPPSEMTAVIQRYQADRGGRGRGPGGGGGDAPAADRQARQKKLAEGWLASLAKIDFDKLSRSGQVDYLLLKNALARDLKAAGLPADATARPKKTDESDIVGRPIGRDALLAALAAEMIPYTPEQLVELANREYAWCEAEMKKAAREMGFGDDWRSALEKVKTLHVPPGGQPKMIRDLAFEALDFVTAKDLVTVPPVCAETWRMDMMTPERQKFSPFFTGGEVISVAFPTNTMSHEAKLQSLRGNNLHFSRATVHHELIPGHHLQQFMNARYQPQRGQFSTPFWTEGWAVYGEMVLYDMGFPKTPEDRVGLMFWRMHRCARVTFSLGFHLGKLTPQQCIDFLVEKVGHERENATAEVRRSFQGGYPPLYQAGYLIGAKQFWALRQELVASGKMTDRAFHDAIMKENHMPVELVRAAIGGGKLARDFTAGWKFAGDLPDAQWPKR